MRLRRTSRDAGTTFAKEKPEYFDNVKLKTGIYGGEYHQNPKNAGVQNKINFGRHMKCCEQNNHAFCLRHFLMTKGFLQPVPTPPSLAGTSNPFPAIPSPGQNRPQYPPRHTATHAFPEQRPNESPL